MPATDHIELNPVATWRNYRSLAEPASQTFIHDTAPHHQPLYFLLGIGDRNLGRRVFARLFILIAFPLWLLGIVALQFSKGLHRNTSKTQSSSKPTTHDN